MKIECLKCDLCSKEIIAKEGFGIHVEGYTETRLHIIVVENLDVQKHICRNCHERIGKHYAQTHTWNDDRSKLSTCQL